MIEKLYTVEEVAEMASVTGRTIRNYLKSGRLVGRKIGGQWRFPESEVQRLLTGESVAADSAPENIMASAPATSFVPPVSREPENPAFPTIPYRYDDGGSANYTPQEEPENVVNRVQEQPILTEAPTMPTYQYTQPASLPTPTPPPVASEQAPVYATGNWQQPPAPVPQTTAQQSVPLTQQPQNPQTVRPSENVSNIFSEQGGPSSPPMHYNWPTQPPANRPQPASPPEASYSFAQNPQPVNTAAAPVSTYATSSPQNEYPAYTAPATPPLQTATPAPLQTPAEESPAKEAPPMPELSDVGKRVAQFVGEVHDCSAGPQMCTVIDLYQSLATARITSERLTEMAQQESKHGIPCQCFVEFDARYYVARYTLFGSSSFLSQCLVYIG